jgi:hypothetical protein
MKVRRNYDAKEIRNTHIRRLAITCRGDHALEITRIPLHPQLDFAALFRDRKRRQS